MAVSVRQALQRFLDRLSTQTLLAEEEAEAILSLNGSDQRIREGVEFVERERVVHSVCVLVEGLVARTSVTTEGRRQISAFYVPGDIPDLYSLMQPRVASSLRAMTQCEIVRISHDDMREAINKHPGLMEAFWRYAVWDASAAVEWIVSLGQRQAPERVGHLFCEMAVKNGQAGPGTVSYRFPITQSILADALGLSAVHVNRSLQRLRSLDLLQVDHAAVTIPDWNKLANWAGFDEGYLRPERPLRVSGPALITS
jgi:CRP-like cAMP-binding protein